MALGAFGLTTNSGASDLSITTAATTVCTVVSGLAAMLACAVFLRFAWGSGGTAVKVYVQTSFDQGTTWVDIACVVFNVATESRVLNFSALTPKFSFEPTDGTLPDDDAIDGVLGDRLRLKIVSTGTYANNTVLAGRVVAR